MLQYLKGPRALILLGVNLVPLAGVILWGWDAFLLLMLYWLETAIIAFWTIVRIATMGRAELGDIRFGESSQKVPTPQTLAALFTATGGADSGGVRVTGSSQAPAPLALAAFFTLHAGIFMCVHFVFLWALFSDDWPKRVHDPREFVDQIILASGLWVPLLALFVGRGALVIGDIVRPRLMHLFNLTPLPPSKNASGPGPAESILLGLYLRIFVMQVTIILGAWFALLFGTTGAYVFLVAVKTAIDLSLQAMIDHVHVAWTKARAAQSAV